MSGGITPPTQHVPDLSGDDRIGVWIALVGRARPRQAEHSALPDTLGKIARPVHANDLLISVDWRPDATGDRRVHRASEVPIVLRRQ